MFDVVLWVRFDEGPRVVVFVTLLSDLLGYLGWCNENVV